MFTQKHGATATYRTLARGLGSGWSRAYRVQQDQAAERSRRCTDAGQAPVAAGPGRISNLHA
jgi:hypothetical protein